MSPVIMLVVLPLFSLSPVFAVFLFSLPLLSLPSLLLVFFLLSVCLLLLSISLLPLSVFLASHVLIVFSLGPADILFGFSGSVHEFSGLSSPRIRLLLLSRLLSRLGTGYIGTVINERTA